jgi:7-cyano-7-deazaguanine synthase
MNVILLSGGMDSTLALFWAKKHMDKLLALTFSYGQVHSREVSAATEVALIAQVPQLINVIDAALTVSSEPGAVVPGRNLLFLASAANLVATQGGGKVIIGSCREDHEGFPDCRPEFFDAVNEMLRVSGVDAEVVTPLVHKTKAEALTEIGKDPDVVRALAQSHSCYRGLEKPCGECGACTYRQASFNEAGVADPLCS